MRNKTKVHKTDTKGEFWDRAQLPTDIILGEAVATVFENRRIQIQNVKGMIECTPEKIRLLTKRNRLEVVGSGLNVKEYSKEEIVIKGNIEQIIYLEK